MKLLTIFLTAITLFLPTYSFAGQGSGWGKIIELNINKHGRLMIRFSKKIVNPDNCQRGDFYIVEKSDSNAANRFYSAILAAHAANKDVQFWISGCTKNKHWGYTRPTPYDIYIK
jgi:hypothetical protein